MGFSAGTMSNIAMGAQAVGAIGSTYSSYRSSQAQQQGYEYQAQVARNNQQLAEWQAQDALERGKVATGNVRLKGAQLAATQRAVFGARNIATNEGSALNILADTAFMAERDARTATDNANKEAWALRNQALGYGNNAGFLQYRADSTSPLMDAGATLLTSGGKVASSWYSLKDSATTPSYTSGIGAKSTWYDPGVMSPQEY